MDVETDQGVVPLVIDATRFFLTIPDVKALAPAYEFTADGTFGMARKNLVAESDDQSDDIFKYDPTVSVEWERIDDFLGPDEIQEIRDVLADLEAVLAGPSTVDVETDQGVVPLVIDVVGLIVALGHEEIQSLLQQIHRSPKPCEGIG